MKRHAGRGSNGTHEPIYSPHNDKPGCNGKRCWPNFAVARNMADRTRRQTHEAIDPYKCRHCGWFHIGGGGYKR